MDHTSQTVKALADRTPWMSMDASHEQTALPTLPEVGYSPGDAGQGQGWRSGGALMPAGCLIPFISEGLLGPAFEAAINIDLSKSMCFQGSGSITKLQGSGQSHPRVHLQHLEGLVWAEKHRPNIEGASAMSWLPMGVQRGAGRVDVPPHRPKPLVLTCR